MEQPTYIDNGLHNEPARNRRKHSATLAALERQQYNHVDIVDAAEILDEADRRLAELGYVAVQLYWPYINSHHADEENSTRFTNASSHGCHAFPSQSRYRVSMPAWPPHMFILSSQVAPLLLSGAG